MVSGFIAWRTPLVCVQIHFVHGDVIFANLTKQNTIVNFIANCNRLQMVRPFGEFEQTIVPPRSMAPSMVDVYQSRRSSRSILFCCWFEIDKIVSRLERTRSELGDGLETVFISTNEDQK